VDAAAVGLGMGAEITPTLHKLDWAFFVITILWFLSTMEKG
jgi:hypothetical protein